MITDENLIKLSYELDEYLLKTAEKYKMSGLSLSAIMLARLIRLNEVIESREDFDNIMTAAMIARPLQDSQTIQ